MEQSGYVELPKEAVKAQDFEMIKKAKRLFYRELFNYNRPTGRWIEIYDVPDFVKLEKKHIRLNINLNCSSKKYLDHHDFHVILEE